jgi:hypothetical protein
MSGDAHQNGDGPSDVIEGGETLAPGPSADSWSRPPRVDSGPTPAGIHFTFYGQTDVGLVREHNEDNFMVADLLAKLRVTWPSTRSLRRCEVTARQRTAIALPDV